MLRNDLSEGDTMYVKRLDHVQICIPTGVEAGRNRSKRHPAFKVVGLNSWRDHLQRHGVRIQEETAIPGVNRFSFRDPFDNRIEFLERT